MSDGDGAAANTLQDRGLAEREAFEIEIAYSSVGVLKYRMQHKFSVEFLQCHTAASVIERMFEPTMKSGLGLPPGHSNPSSSPERCSHVGFKAITTSGSEAHAVTAENLKFPEALGPQCLS
jgi:hypothetical protein